VRFDARARRQHLGEMAGELEFELKWREGDDGTEPPQGLEGEYRPSTKRNRRSQRRGRLRHASISSRGARLAGVTLVQGLLVALMLGQVRALSAATFVVGFVSSALVSRLESLVVASRCRRQCAQPVVSAEVAPVREREP
jgi:hypothetical protein